MADVPAEEGAAEVVEGEEAVAEEEEKLNRRLVLHGEPAQFLRLPNQPRLGNTMIDTHVPLGAEGSSLPELWCGATFSRYVHVLRRQRSYHSCDGGKLMNTPRCWHCACRPLHYTEVKATFSFPFPFIFHIVILC